MFGVSAYHLKRGGQKAGSCRTAPWILGIAAKMAIRPKAKAFDRNIVMPRETSDSNPNNKAEKNVERLDSRSDGSNSVLV